jgi:AcrR family transcriptional regulator
MKVKRRPYRMSARAEAAERTGEAILSATAALWREQALDAITLEAIAERAGVSVRTVIRRFGSKEGVVAACIASDGAGIDADRNEAPPGDVDAALDVLLSHYERDGDAVLRTLAIEDTVPAAKAVVEAGRASHRAWCARIFADHLPLSGDRMRRARLDAFVAVTDVYLWKLLRRDLGRSPPATRRVIRHLVDGLIAEAAQSS